MPGAECPCMKTMSPPCVCRRRAPEMIEPDLVQAWPTRRNWKYVRHIPSSCDSPARPSPSHSSEYRPRCDVQSNDRPDTRAGDRWKSYSGRRCLACTADTRRIDARSQSSGLAENGPAPVRACQGPSRSTPATLGFRSGQCRQIG